MSYPLQSSSNSKIKKRIRTSKKKNPKKQLLVDLINPKLKQRKKELEKRKQNNNKNLLKMIKTCLNGMKNLMEIMQIFSKIINGKIKN